MKSKVLLVFAVLFLFNKASGQINFQENIIGTLNSPKGLFAADLDGDGDLDVLSVSQATDVVVWFENIDGAGDFGDQQIISSMADGANTVHARDLDGDGDMDVLSGSSFDGIIAWYENLDGEGNFGSQQIISEGLTLIKQVYTADLDGDGDFDVLSAANDDITWFDNLNGQGNFGSPQIITNEADGIFLIYADDLDGDLDMDLLSASFVDNKIAWYQNLNGLGTFGSQKIIANNVSGTTCVHAKDLDGDGDLDVLSTSQFKDEISWYKNMDGQGSFSDATIISANFEVAQSVSAGDIDGDGDMDIIATSTGDDKTAWFENLDGQGTFSSEKIVSTNSDGAMRALPYDINGDGNLDILSLSFLDGKIAWHENLNILSTKNLNKLEFSIYPIPANTQINVLSEIEIQYIELYNMLGLLVMSSGSQSKIDISMLEQGTYFCKVVDKTGSWGIKSLIVHRS